MSGQKMSGQKMSGQKKVGFVSLGCPKALVDSEHIVTRLADAGYEVVSEEEGSEVVVVNTCGFIDSAKAETFDTIEAALAADQEVIVTGCMGADASELRERFPSLKHISGPADVDPVVAAVQSSVGQFEPSPSARGPQDGTLQGEARVRLTPAHYAYLKISEGCNHDCSFCIIPDMRGPLRSRGIDDVVAEAECLVADGAKELLVIAQDLSAYGVDLKYAAKRVKGVELPTRLTHLCEQLGDIAPWVRLHYVYPYPSVDQLIPLMADGKILPYLDIPLQHAAPRILKAMRRPAAAEKTLRRIERWREICPDIAIRSTFIVGFPGETDDDVGELLDFLSEAKLERAGCFTYSAVAGAAANALPGAVDERDKLDRQEAVYELQAGISAARLSERVGQTLRVLVDAPGVARSMYDAPEIDGVVHLEGDEGRVGEFAWAEITAHDEHDLFGRVVGHGLNVR